MDVDLSSAEEALTVHLRVAPEKYCTSCSCICFVPLYGSYSLRRESVEVTFSSRVGEVPEMVPEAWGCFFFFVWFCSYPYMQSKRLLSELLPRLSLPSSLSPACTLRLKFFLKFSPLAWPWIVLCPNIDPLKHSELLPDTQTTSALRHLKRLLQSMPLGRQRRGWESSLVSDGFYLTENIFHAIQCSSVWFCWVPVVSC